MLKITPIKNNFVWVTCLVGDKTLLTSTNLYCNIELPKQRCLKLAVNVVLTVVATSFIYHENAIPEVCKRKECVECIAFLHKEEAIQISNENIKRRNIKSVNSSWLLLDVNALKILIKGFAQSTLKLKSRWIFFDHS